MRERHSLSLVVMLALVLGERIQSSIELEVTGKMSKQFWQQHSIKGKESPAPSVADSLVSQLRAGRVDVSGMSQGELASHMEDEASLRRRIRLARGLPEILPTPEVILAETAGVPSTRDIAMVTPADATQVRVRGR